MNRDGNRKRFRRIALLVLLAATLTAIVFFVRTALIADKQERPELLLPEATVHVAPGSHPFASAPRELGDVEYEFEGRESTLDRFLQRGQARAFLVLHDGNIVFERYASGFDENSKQQSWSMAKSVLSVLYGIALDRGQIDDLDDPLTEYVPELKANGFDGVTIEQALSMSSGVDWVEKGPQREQLIRNAVINNLTLGVAGKTVDESTGDSALGRKSDPGRVYNYASINSQALGWVLERATGERYHRLLEAWIWRPAGMTTSAEVMTDGSGNDFTFCCLHATARDYARFGWLMANGGRANGRQLISRSWVKRSTSVERFKTDDGYGYALHWRTPHDKAGDFAAAGYAGQMIYVSPANRTVVVRLARDKETRPFETFTLSRAIGERLARP